MLYGAFRYPGVVEHVGALDTRDGTVRRLADIKGAMHYMVASFAYDPGTGTAFYTDDNTALRDLMAVDVKTGEVRTLLEDASIGEIVFNPADRSLLGVRHLYGLATLVRIPYPYTEWKEIYTLPLGTRAFRPRHLARRAAAVGVDQRRQGRPVPARVGPRHGSWRAT